jgi:signal transduction histidine kinase
MPTASFASLRARLLLLIALAVLPALGLIFYVNLEQRRLAATQAQDEALRLARLAAAEQAQLVQGAHQLLAALALLPVVRDRDPSGCSALFATLLKHYPAYANLGAAKADGESFCSAVPLAHPVNSAAYAWFQRAVHTREFSVGEYQKSLATGNFTLILGYPIRNEADQVQGVVAAALDLGRLNQVAAHAQLPPGATLIAVDRNGTIISRYPAPERWIGQVLQEAPLIKAILTHREGTAELPGADGVQRLYAFTQVQGTSNADLYVSIGIPTEVAFAAAHQRLVRNLVTVGLITLFMVTAAWIGSEVLISRRVDALIRATKRLRAGDLTARTELPRGQGELDQVAVAFDDMAEALAQRQAERRRSEETLQLLSRRLLEAQESERRAIARELHDELGQALQALKINLQTAQRFPQEGAARLADSIGIVDQTIQQVRALSVDLRPSVLDDLGLVAALEWYVERQAQRIGFSGQFVAEPPDLRVDPTVETVCFRVVQEALTNVARHAQARQVWVELKQQGDTLDLVIRDDGVGFDVSAAQERAAQGASFGLLGMWERVELAGGHIEMDSTPGQGTEIRIRFPLRSLAIENLQSSAPTHSATA